MNENIYHDDANSYYDDFNTNYSNINLENDDRRYLIGNSVNFLVNKDDCEIKADVLVNVRESIRVWGQVKDCNGRFVKYAFVKLLKKTPNGLVGVAHTISDAKGFYQFDLGEYRDKSDYTIIVSKATNCKERIISNFIGKVNNQNYLFDEFYDRYNNSNSKENLYNKCRECNNTECYYHRYNNTF